MVQYHWEGGYHCEKFHHSTLVNCRYSIGLFQDNARDQFSGLHNQDDWYIVSKILFLSLVLINNSIRPHFEDSSIGSININVGKDGVINWWVIVHPKDKNKVGKSSLLKFLPT
jgi:hypothetical protein